MSETKTAIFVTWIVLKTPHWEVLGWLGRITTDRSVDYALRETRKPAMSH